MCCSFQHVADCIPFGFASEQDTSASIIVAGKPYRRILSFGLG